MSTFKKIGLITSGKSVHSAATMSAVLAQYPQAEIVSDKQEIMADEDINLVFVSPHSAQGEQQDLVGQVIRSGKYVRII